MPQRAKRDILGFKGDECDCGRRATILHCNSCGSTRIYARSNRQHTHLNGEVKFVETQFKCMTCGHTFIQEERQYCDAPPVSEALAKLKVKRLTEAAKTGEYLRPDDKQASEAIADILKAQASTSEAQNPNEVVEKKFIPAGETATEYPNGLTREEYTNAKNVFIAEWAYSKKERGTPPTETVEEYIQRRFAGETIPL